MWKHQGLAVIAMLIALIATGTAMATPPEATGLRFTAPDSFEWDPALGMDGYNVYRDLTPDDPHCLYAGLPTPGAIDGSTPPPGGVYYYLITTAKQAHESTLGEDSGGIERPNLNPCLVLPPPRLDRINPNGPGFDGVWQGKEAPRNPGIGNDLNGLAGGGVYLHTAEYFVQEVDLEIPGSGIKWQHVRYYRSQINHDGQQGRNWTFNYDRRVLSGEGSLIYMDGTGREDEYLFSAASIWEPVDAGLYTKLRQEDDGSFVLRERDGTLYFHHPLDGTEMSGRLTAIEDRNENTLRFLYDSAGHLVTAVDTLGRGIEYYWTADARLGSVVDYTGREVRYEYDADGNLITARSPVVLGTSTGNDFPVGKTTEYSYSTGYLDPKLNHNLELVTAFGDSMPVITNQYTPDDELDTQYYGGVNASGIWAGGQYDYAVSMPGGGVRETTVIDRRGNEHLFKSDSEGHVTYEDVNGWFEKEHFYNGTGERTLTVMPLGNEVYYEYDEANPDRFQRGNLTEITRVADAARGDGHGGALAPITVRYEYEPLYTQQRVIVDPHGRASEYVYDYQEGDPLTNGVDFTATLWNITLGGIPLGLGEINGDGDQTYIHGNPIRLKQPDVTPLPGGRQESVEGGALQPVETLYRYNRYGQLTVQIDPEYNVTLHSYFPATDPDGNGIPTPPPPDGRFLDPVTGGYRAYSVLDADPSGIIPDPQIGRRNNATNPVPAAIVNDFLWDEAGNLTASIDGNGTQTDFEVNALGQIVSIRRGAVSDRSINLDPDPPLAGFLVEQIFNERDEIVERRLEDHGDLSNTGGMIETLFVHDILGNVVSLSREVETGVFATTDYRYDGEENRIATIFPEGNIHTLQLDTRGLLDKLRRDDSDTDPFNGGGLVTDYDYDLNGNLLTYTDANNNAWPFVYDGMDRRVRATIYPDFPAESFFDVYYNPDESIGRMEITNTGGTIFYDADYVHDELGRVTELRQSIRNSGGGLILEDADSDGYVSVLTEYDRNSRRSRLWTDDRSFTDYDLDGAGRMLRLVDALGNETSFGYDSNNNAVMTTEIELGVTGNELFTKLNSYDRLNRLTTTTDDPGNTTGFSYDSRDNLIELTDALGNVNTYSYDGLDRRIETRRELRVGGQAPGAVYDQIVYGRVFDLNGRLELAIDPEGNITTYSYDGLDRRYQTTYDDGTFEKYDYDNDDSVIGITDANGSVITIGRDKAGRITGRTVATAPGVHGVTQTYEYDPLNRLVHAIDQNDGGPAERTEVWFDYDSLNRVRGETSKLGANAPRTISYDYDGDGNRLSANWPGASLSYSYDTLNRLNRAHDGVPGGYQADYTYLGPERVAERLHENGTRKSYLDPSGTVDDGYDSLKQVVRLRHYDPTNAAIYNSSYSYDPVGNVIRSDDIALARSDTWRYDSAYRVVEYNRDLGTGSPTQIQYTLDKVGNWLDRMVNGQPLGNTPNNLNEYDEPQSGGTRVDDGVPDDFNDDLNTPNPDGINLGHDKNGNLVTEGTVTYEYDPLNRLVWVRDGGSDVAHYIYDGLNRRIAKQEFALGYDRRYVYDGDMLIEEWDYVEFDLFRRYFHGIGGELVAMLDVGLGEYYYLHDDLRGSVSMVTDGGGAVIERISYDAYGEPRFEDPAGNPTGMTESVIGNPFLYQGQFWDTETQLYEDRGALFAPRFGRHLQRHVPGQHLGPLGQGLNVPRFWPCFVNWFGMNPFWWSKAQFWHPGTWHCGWWAWKPGWWWGGPWGWWAWRPWVWVSSPFDAWWTVNPWAFWWHHPFNWWGWQSWWPWPGWWGFWPYWGWMGWSHWIPSWGFIGWKAWWPWWGYGGWTGFYPTFGWWGWLGWWPGWSDWWQWHPSWWWGWWTWSPWWWHGFWGWSAFSLWRWCWGWLHWWPWGWWNWAGWLGWWGWFGWNPWWYWGWWSWWDWGMIRGFHWWWGPLGWGPWFCSFWPGWWWGWWWWLWPGCWLWRIGWWGFFAWPWWWVWRNGWLARPWWGWFRSWGWWWPWWGFFG